MPKPQKFPEMHEVIPSGVTDIVLNDDDEALDLAVLLTITDEMDKARHIDQALRTLQSIMIDSSLNTAGRVAAAKLTLEACGQIGKGTTNNTYVRADNAQINQTEINDTDTQKIKEAVSGMGKLLRANDAGIKIHTGGKGV